MTLPAGTLQRSAWHIALLPAAQRPRAVRAVRAVKCGAQQQQLDDQPPFGLNPLGSSGNASTDDDIRVHFISSLATLGLGATLLSERLNGVGVVEQLELWNKGLDPFIVLTIGSLMVAGLMPRSSSFRPGTAEAAVEDVQTIAGRVSFLGLAATLAAEMLTGKGLLGLLHIDTGVELSEVEGILAFLVMLILTGTHKHTNPRT